MNPRNPRFSSAKVLVSLCLPSWFCLQPFVTTAADYKGAEAVLTEAKESGAKPEAADTLSPTAQLRADLKAFSQTSGTLKPAEGAEQWLKLLERFRKSEELPMPGRRRPDAMPIEVREVIEALPPPPCWGEVEKSVDSRPAGEGAEALQTLGLKLLAHTLNGHKEKRSGDLSTLQGLAAKTKSSQ